MSDVPAPSSRHLLLYDGVCGLCDRSVQTLLKLDRQGVHRFAPLQSGLAARTLARHGEDAGELKTVFFLRDFESPEERCFKRSRAVIASLIACGGAWKLLWVLWPLPSVVLDLGYRLVARLRYRLFGRSETCRLPRVEERHRFLGLDEIAPQAPQRETPGPGSA